jgi:predicted RNA-binding Zn-ribbon protein involved in translation (DUF1610 family)
MFYCAKCKKEMTCKKTGVDVRFHGEWAYRGDLFVCKSCGNETIHTSSNSTGYTNKTQHDYMFDIEE